MLKKVTAFDLKNILAKIALDITDNPITTLFSWENPVGTDTMFNYNGGYVTILRRQAHCLATNSFHRFGNPSDNEWAEKQRHGNTGKETQTLCRFTSVPGFNEFNIRQNPKPSPKPCE